MEPIFKGKNIDLPTGGCWCHCRCYCTDWSIDNDADWSAIFMGGAKYNME